MLTTTVARLLEGAPSETTEKAVAANSVLGAVLGGMNPQHAIVAGGGPDAHQQPGCAVGSQGPGKPGTAVGGMVQGVENAVTKVKDALT